MEFVILTGLSGAGKTNALHAMEDSGFYCVDNLPPLLLDTFYDLCDNSTDNRSPLVVSIADGYESRDKNGYSQEANLKNPLLNAFVFMDGLIQFVLVIPF